MDPMKGAQDIIRCDVCSNNEREKSPAEVHCNTCHTNVCSPCVARHMALDKSKKHDIVLFHVASTEIILPSCSSHTKLKCDLFCKKCSIPICLKCLSSNHNSHNVEELTELCQKIYKDVQNETEELQQCIIPELENILGEEDEKLRKLNEAYDKLDSSFEEHGKNLHRRVDAVISKYKTKVQQRKQTDAKILQQQMEEVNEILSDAKQAAVKNKALLKSKNASSLIVHNSKNANLTEVPNLRNIIPPNFTLKPIPADFLDSVIGEIPDSQVRFREESIIQTNDKQEAAVGASSDRELLTYSFSTPYKRLHRLACTRSEQIWTSSNENTLRCLDMYTGSIVATAVLDLNPIAICINTANELLICDRTTVYKRELTGVIVPCCSVPSGWNAEALAKSSALADSCGFFLFLRHDDNRQSKVLRIVDGHLTGLVRGEYQYDNHGKELFNSNCYDFFLAENRNGDICVSDTTSLVVLDRRGKFRFRYHGKVFDTFYKPFQPRGVSTDSLGSIFLADLDNRCIHVLDKDGRFVRYITCGGSLDKLCDVSCDEKGRLWVAERHTAKVKCIEYQVLIGTMKDIFDQISRLI
ncbi:E3 ubiquitin-protein ligase TRIM71 [Magallana gigas]|uniref:E3 ubiquitin-protein ligase TRIM71 n=1 Tax=Magallana gigas TaxID=29159 RepID=UPI003341C71D